MTTAPATDRVTLERRVPPLGGFNLTYLGIELKRKLRNRRTSGCPCATSRSRPFRSPWVDHRSPPTSWSRWPCTER